MCNIMSEKILVTLGKKASMYKNQYLDLTIFNKQKIVAEVPKEMPRNLLDMAINQGLLRIVVSKESVQVIESVNYEDKARKILVSKSPGEIREFLDSITRPLEDYIFMVTAMLQLEYNEHPRGKVPRDKVIEFCQEFVKRYTKAEVPLSTIEKDE